MLPITKIPGAANPSDLCTKNVPVTLLEQYLGQLNIYFADGRAAVAQQLHALVITHPGGGALLSKDGCQGKASGPTAPEVGVVLAGAGADAEDERAGAPPSNPGLCPVDSRGGGVKRRVRTKTPAERGVESWMNYGEEGIWKRAHRTPRWALFTPHRVAGGPGREVVVGGRRTTIGT